MKEKFYKLPIFWIFVGALLVRVLGVRWGLPNEIRNYSLHPDEQVNLLYARQIIPTQLHFTPGAYNYGTLYLSLLRILSDIVLTYAGGMDQAGNIAPAAMGQIHLAGRLVNCLFGAGLASLTFAIGSRTIGKTGAWISAGIVGIAPALLVHSRFQTVDMLATLLAVAAVYAAVRMIEPEAAVTKWAVWGGVFAGLSAGTKYVGLVAVGAVVVAAFIVKQPKTILFAIFASVVAFVISTPGCILDREAFMRDFLFELNHSKEGHGVVFMATPPAFLYHIGNLSSGASILTVLLGFAGLVWAVVKKQPWAMIVGAFFLVYYVAVSGGQIKFMRYILPLIPVLALGVGYIVERIKESGKEKAGIALGLLVIGGIDRGGLVQAGSLTVQMMLPDPRDIAGKYLIDKGNVTVGLVDDPWFWSPTVNPDADVTRMIGPRRLIELWTSWVKPKVLRYLPEDPRERYEWDVRLLTEMKPDYVSFTSFEYVPFMRMAQVQNKTDLESLYASRYTEFMTELTKDYDKVLDNDPFHAPMVEDMEYVRPHVLVWKRKTTSASP
ncbi:MAG: glycosyltransferase family 39 protein [Armatimonadetes bacterium]|nr:glycosyltransferase family 39 protein [Armatimonadota bacterium]